MHFARSRLAKGISAALGIVLSATVWAATGVAEKPAAAVGMAAAAQAGDLAVASSVLNRWEPVAQAAGMYNSIWREQFQTQLGQMSADALVRLDNIKVDE